MVFKNPSQIKILGVRCYTYKKRTDPFPENVTSCFFLGYNPGQSERETDLSHRMLEYDLGSAKTRRQCYYSNFKLLSPIIKSVHVIVPAAFAGQVEI